MYRFSTSVPFWLFVLGSFSLASAGAPIIGVAVSEGSILLNDARTAGNATVFSGNTLQTQTDMSQVRLNNGAQVQIAPESRAQLFSDRVMLEKGTARISDYSAVAHGLSVRADRYSSAAISTKDGAVEVAALSGNVNIFNSSGVMIAKVLPGRTLDLRPQETGTAAPSMLTGCVVRNGDSYLLTDEVSDVTVQLRGSNLRAGQRVQVTGTVVPNATPAAGAAEVLQVTNVRQVDGTCVAGVAGTIPASGAGAGAESVFGRGALIAGVAIAAAAVFVSCAKTGCWGGSPAAQPAVSGGTVVPSPF